MIKLTETPENKALCGVDGGVGIGGMINRALTSHD